MATRKKRVLLLFVGLVSSIVPLLSGFFFGPASMVGASGEVYTFTTIRQQTVVEGTGGVFGATPVDFGYTSNNTGYTANVASGSCTTPIYLTNVAKKTGGGYTANMKTGNATVGRAVPGATCTTAFNNTLNGSITVADPNGQGPGGGNPPAEQTPTSTTTDATNTSTTITCDATGSPLTWILCPVFNFLSDFSQWALSNVIQPLLIAPPISTDPSSGSFKVWSEFRIYGNVFLVIALLVTVFGEAIGGGLIDAYTAKKVLPRLLVAAILINLSLYIVAFLVDLSNILGGGIADLLIEPYKSTGLFNFQLNLTQQVGVMAVGLIGAILSAASVGAFIFALFTKAGAAFAKVALEAAFFMVLPLFLGAIGVFITLVARQGIILALIILSPIAFALYCLPSTEQHFRRWWKILTETLLVYPIVMGLFAIADILSMTILQANNVSIGSNSTNPSQSIIDSIGQGTSQSSQEVLAVIVAFVLQFLPLFAAPFAFRIAGGTIGRVHDMVIGARHKVNEAAQGRRDQAKQKYQVQKLQGQQGAYSKFTGVAGKMEGKRFGGIRKKGLNFMASRVGGYNIDAGMSAMNAQIHKEMNDQIMNGDDAEIRGLSVNKAAALSRRGAVWNAAANSYVDSVSGQQIAESELNATDNDGNFLYGYRTKADGSRDFRSLGGKMVSESAVDRGRERWKNNSFAGQTALAYEMKKASTSAEIQNLKTHAGEVLTSKDGMNLNESQATSAWIGAGFENQQNKREFKNMDAHFTKGGGTVTTNYDKLSSEVYENIGTYPLSQFNASTVGELTAAYRDADPTTANGAERRRQLEQVASTLSSRMGSRQFVPGEEGAVEGVTGGGASSGAAHLQEAVADFVSTTRGNQNGGNGGGGIITPGDSNFNIPPGSHP